MDSFPSFPVDFSKKAADDPPDTLQQDEHGLVMLNFRNSAITNLDLGSCRDESCSDVDDLQPGDRPDPAFPVPDGPLIPPSTASKT